MLASCMSIKHLEPFQPKDTYRDTHSINPRFKQKDEEHT
jgi:hypothetical protein